jgi:hypothetical protein
MAVYCREQAYCHFSPALIADLENTGMPSSEKSSARTSTPGSVCRVCSLRRQPHAASQGFHRSKPRHAICGQCADNSVRLFIGSGRKPDNFLCTCTMNAMAKIGVARLIIGIATKRRWPCPQKDSSVRLAHGFSLAVGGSAWRQFEIFAPSR